MITNYLAFCKMKEGFVTWKDLRKIKQFLLAESSFSW
jgi:hypothetical protein